MRHVENLYKESQGRAVKANEWLLPQEAGFLETEGGWHQHGSHHSPATHCMLQLLYRRHAAVHSTMQKEWAVSVAHYTVHPRHSVQYTH
jgi:hypothetical protein